MRVFDCILLAILVLIFFKDNLINKSEPIPYQETRDTIIIQLPVQNISFPEMPKPEIVYVEKKDIERHTIERQAINNYIIDTTKVDIEKDSLKPVNLTKDSVTNKDGTFYLSALHESVLYDLDLDYKLNQKEITKTIVIPPLSSLSFSVGLRGGVDNFDVPIGIDYDDKNNWGAYFRYSHLNKHYEIGYRKDFYQFK